MQNIYYNMAKINYKISVGKIMNMKLKLARIEKNLSQQELADLVDATRQTIGLIEKAKYNPSLNLCLRIAWALDKTLDQLFWEEKNEK